MKSYQFLIFVLLIIPILIQAQSYNATIEQIINGSNLDVSLYLRHTGTTSPVLGSCSFYINYNKDALTNPTLQADGQWDGTYNTGYGQNLVNFNPSTGIASIEVVKSGTPTFQIPDVKTHLGTIRFTIEDETKLSDVSWNNSWTEVFDVNDADIESDGTFTNPGDFSLPVELTSFNALIDHNMVKLRWVTESEINNAGFELYRSPSNEDSYNILSSYLYNPELLGQGNSNIRHEYKYEDNTIESGNTYWYKLADVDLNGAKTFHAPISVTLSDQVLPTRYRLYPAFPNPFNPSTRLRFDIPDNEGTSVKASLVIYNTLGQIVKTIYRGYSETGSYDFQWFGDSEKGDIVPNGIYYVVLRTEKYQQSRKLILMK
jgi:hypothetical protein